MLISAPWRVSAALVALLLTTCTESPPAFHAEGDPTRLSDWQLFTLSADALTPASTSVVFTPANQLFTDYAQKLRTLWLPEGSQAQLVDGEIDYPVGTILTKTFYYPLDNEGRSVATAPQADTAIDLTTNTLIETRLLVRRANGWTAFPYVWNTEQTEAFLREAGASRPVELAKNDGTTRFTYFVPNRNQCAGCHVTEHPAGAMHPLGAIAAQLHAPFGTELPAGPLQTEALVARGWLNAIPGTETTVSWLDANAETSARAAAYLNMQCGHCHNPDGAADTSALLLDGSAQTGVHLGVCKPPVAAGGGAGDRLYGIVPGDPERSILLYRMDSTAPDEMMPELGRSLIHDEGVALIRRWISEMSGTC